MCKFAVHEITLRFVHEHTLTSGQQEPVQREEGFSPATFHKR